MAEATKAQETQVQQAKPVKHQCDGCSGDGQYFRGHIENGVRKGFIGTCFRCGGKGWQSEADRKRNYGYDRFYRRFD
jgi:DnaJ-class molecular chaperone